MCFKSPLIGQASLREDATTGKKPLNIGAVEVGCTRFLGPFVLKRHCYD